MSATVTDLFCGAGGSSIGLTAAGAELVIAANHWQLAVDVHQANFPDADHDCADISQANPRRYPATDVLWASPECTNHSQAKGIARALQHEQLPFEDRPSPESADRSRATMWDVIRFLEAKKLQGRPYKAAIVENVVDAAKWVLFAAWRHAIESLGYDVHPVYLNSMHASGWETGVAPAPQSRDRVYFVCVPHGVAVDLDLRPRAWCPQCESDVDARQVWKRPEQRWGRYRAQYVYCCPKPGHGAVEPYTLPAATAIDWELIGDRIGDRARPLKPATIRRIEAGVRKYARPYIQVERSGRPRHDPLEHPLATVCASGNHHGFVVPPMLVPLSRTQAVGKTGTPVDMPAATFTARQDVGMVVPPFIAELRGGSSETRGVDEPLATMTASGTHHLMVVPPGFISRHNVTSGEVGWTATGLDEPVRTMTAKGQQSLVLIPPKLVMAYYGRGQVTAATQPLPTQTSVDRFAAIDPAELVDDCLFRMLAPHEIGAAMAFPATYQVLGNKRDRVRMYGNAVTPPAAALLFERVLAAIDSTDLEETA